MTQLALDFDFRPVAKFRKRGPDTSRTAARRAQPWASPEITQEVRHMCEVGMTLETIKKKFGIGHKTLKKIIHHNGIYVQALQKRKPEIINGLAYIPLTKGYTAIVDEGDLSIIGDWQWSASVRYDCAGNITCVYAQRRISLSDGTSTLLRLHRALLNPSSSFDVDHIDGNGLNNRRSNLRVASRSQNGMNRGISKANTSGIKGVFYDKRRKRWVAKIKVNGRSIWLGSFQDRARAAEIYAIANARLHKEFGRVA